MAELLEEVGDLLGEVGGDRLAARGPARGQGLEMMVMMRKLVTLLTSPVRSECLKACTRRRISPTSLGMSLLWDIM